MNDPALLLSTLNALLSKVKPVERKKLARTIGQAVTKNQRQRIGRNINPDGSPFTPRKKINANKKGKVKQAKMFTKLKTARYLKLQTSADKASLSFTGKGATIADVHQYGKVGRVSNTIRVKYEQRQLLGFTEQESKNIQSMIISALADNL